MLKLAQPWIFRFPGMQLGENARCITVGYQTSIKITGPPNLNFWCPHGANKKWTLLVMVQNTRALCQPGKTHGVLPERNAIPWCHVSVKSWLPSDWAVLWFVLLCLWFLGLFLLVFSQLHDQKLPTLGNIMFAPNSLPGVRERDRKREREKERRPQPPFGPSVDSLCHPWVQSHA